MRLRLDEGKVVKWPSRFSRWNHGLPFIGNIEAAMVALRLSDKIQNTMKVSRNTHRDSIAKVYGSEMLFRGG